MNPISRSILSVAISFFISITLSLTSCQSQQGTSQFYDEIDKLLDKDFDPNGPGYAILIGYGDEVLYERSAGLANLELEVEMVPENVFQIASLTKQFTAVAVLKLAVAGKLNLTDSLSQYVDHYAGTGIIIEHLLSHSSGIPDYTKQPYFTAATAKMDMEIDDQINLFKDDSLLFTPGTDFGYSNTGYLLLGKIIEVVSGLSYGEFIQKEILVPLQLTNTHYNRHQSIIKNRISGYSKNEDTFQNAVYISDKLPYAGGGLLSNPRDLFKWHRALLKGQLLPVEMITMAQRAYEANGKTSPEGYGFGWRQGIMSDEPIIYHTGAINGFMSAAMYFPESDIYMAMISNCDCIFPGMYISQIAPIILPNYTKATD